MALLTFATPGAVMNIIKLVTINAAIGCIFKMVIHMATAAGLVFMLAYQDKICRSIVFKSELRPSSRGVAICAGFA